VTYCRYALVSLVLTTNRKAAEMKFIQVTNKQNNEKTYLNSDRIKTIRPSGDGAKILMVDAKQEFEVVEGAHILAAHANN